MSFQLNNHVSKLIITSLQPRIVLSTKSVPRTKSYLVLRTTFSIESEGWQQFLLKPSTIFELHPIISGMLPSYSAFLAKNLAIHRMATMVARQPNTKKIRSYESSEFWLHSFGVVFPSKICHRPTNQSVALLRLVKFDEN